MTNKGSDLVEIRHKKKDVDVLWRNPAFIPGGLISTVKPWTNNFFDAYPGGWQEVFPNSHLPTDEYKNAPLGLHGEVCLLNWDYVVIEQSDQCAIVEMSVHTVNTPFHLLRRVKIEKGQEFFTFDETITNIGNEKMHYNWGHHPVFGPPFIEEGCIIDTPENAVAVIPDKTHMENSYFVSGLYESWPQVKTISGTFEDASFIKNKDFGTSDSFYLELNEGWVALRNPAFDLGICLAWDVSIFSYLWMWQAYSGNTGYPFYMRNYNVALEPFSVPIQKLTESIREGHANLLKAKESRSTSLFFGFTSGRKPISNISIDGRITTKTY